MEARRIGQILRNFLPTRRNFPGRLVRTVGCDVLTKKGEVHPMLLERDFRLFNNGEKLRRPFVTTVRVVRARSLVRSSLPTVSGSACEEKGGAARTVFNRTVNILDNSTLLGCTCRAMLESLTIQAKRRLSTKIQTLRVLTSGAKTCNVLNNRDISIVGRGGRKDTLARGRLGCVCLGGASTLLRTPLVANTILTKTSRRRIRVVRRVNHCANLTFRVRSSVLSRADAVRRLNGPVRSSRSGRGIACIALHNVSKTTTRMRLLARGTIKVLSSLVRGEKKRIDTRRKDDDFLQSLLLCLTLHGG